MSARRGDNCFVVPPRLSLSLLRLACSLCPILSGVRPPDLVMQIERKKRKRKMRKRDRILPLLYPLAITLSFSLSLSLSLSWVLIITRFCVTSLNKALPCLLHFLPASVCMCMPLQGLTVIRSAGTDTLGM